MPVFPEPLSLKVRLKYNRTDSCNLQEIIYEGHGCKRCPQAIDVESQRIGFCMYKRRIPWIR